MKFHHVGVSVANIDRAIVNMPGIVEVQDKIRTYDPKQDAMLQMVDWGGLQVELIDRGKSQDTWNMYHLCFEVQDLDKEVIALTEQDYILISAPKEALLFDGRRVAFLMGPNRDIIELLEEKC